MADEIDTSETARLLLRVPARLKDQVQERAAANQRSMNTELVAILEEAVNGLSGARLRDLLDDYKRTKENVEILSASLNSAKDQQAAIEREIFDRIKRAELGQLPEADKLIKEASRILGDKQAPMSWSEKVEKAGIPKAL